MKIKRWQEFESSNFSMSVEDFEKKLDDTLNLSFEECTKAAKDLKDLISHSLTGEYKHGWETKEYATIWNNFIKKYYNQFRKDSEILGSFYNDLEK